MPVIEIDVLGKPRRFEIAEGYTPEDVEFLAMEAMKGVQTSEPSTTTAETTTYDSAASGAFIGSTEKEPQPQYQHPLLARLSGREPGMLKKASPTIARLGTPLAGAYAMAPAGPWAAAGGAVAGGIVGSILGQEQEKELGYREEVNPWLVGLEGAEASVPLMGKTVKTAAVIGAAYVGGSTVARQLVDGQPLDLGYVDAMTAIIGGAITGLTRGVINKKTAGEAVRKGLVEIFGDNEITEAAWKDLTKRLIKQERRSRASTRDIARRFDVSEKSLGAPGSMSFDDPTEDLGHSIAARRPRAKGKVKGTTGLIGAGLPEDIALPRMQKQTGVPVWDDFRKLRERSIMQHNAMDKYTSGIRGAYKKTRAKSRVDIGAIVRESGLDPKSVRLAAKDLGVDPEKALEITSTISRIENEFGTDFADYALKNIPLETDGLRMTTKFLHYSSAHKYLGDEWGKAFQKYSKHPDPAIARQMNRVLNAMVGDAGQAGKTVSRAMTDTLNRLGMKNANVDARALVGQMVSMNYGGALGFRLTPIVRNSFQTLQLTYPMLGKRWYAYGLRHALTKRGKQRAIDAGIIRGQAEDISELENITTGNISRRIQRVNKVAMWGFLKSEQSVRAQAFNGMYGKTINAARRSRGDLNKFLSRSDVDRFQDAPRDWVSSLYLMGDYEGASVEAAKHLTRVTHFDYSAAGRPKILTEYGPLGLAGKAGGGFGTWGASYAGYLSDYMLPGRANGPGWKVARDIARLAEVNIAIGATFAGLGSMFGDENSVQDAMAWLGASPLIYTGSPALEAFTSSVETIREGASGRDVISRSSTGELKYSRPLSRLFRAGSTFIPGGVAVPEHVKAFEDLYHGRWGKAAMREFGAVRGNK